MIRFPSATNALSLSKKATEMKHLMQFWTQETIFAFIYKKAHKWCNIIYEKVLL